MDKNITVTLDDVHRERIEEVADQLRAAGMRDQHLLRTLGIITGTMPESRRDAIANVPGVAQVEDQEVFQLPPPDAEIQ
jgi:hypothetical protein